MVGQLNPRVRVLGILITMSRKEARSVVVMMDLDQNLFPSTASFSASVSIDKYRCWRVRVRVVAYGRVMVLVFAGS